MTETARSDINEAWRSLVEAVVNWQSNHMDQWERFKFATRHGHVYVTVSYASDYPDSFDLVDRETGELIKQAGQS